MLSTIERITVFVTILFIVTQVYLHKPELLDFSFKTKNEAMVDVNSNIEDETIFGNDTEADLEEVHQNPSVIRNDIVGKKCEGLCTAELLLDGKEINSESENFPWERGDDGKLRWKVTEEAQSCCHIDNPFLSPLQSSKEDIQNALEKKWLLIIGDSSVRMIFDYLKGRWIGSWEHWGDSEELINPMNCAGNGKRCYSDLYVRGARVTFVWFPLDLKDVFEDFLSHQVGVPNVVVAEHGYWEKQRAGRTEKIEHGEMFPKKILDILGNKGLDEFYPKAFSYREKQRHLWMSAFDKDFLHSGNNTVGDLVDGSRSAKESGWEHVDRTLLFNEGSEIPGAHPKDESLEIELELLIQIMKNVQIE